MQEWKAGHRPDRNNQLRKKAAGIFARAEHHRRSEQGDKALAGYDQAVALMPHHVGYRLARARYNYSRGEDKAALIDIEYLLALHGDNIEVMSLQAQVLIAGGHHVEAIECYTRMLKLNPASAAIHYNRAYLYYVMGLYQESLRDLDQACAINPQLFEAYYYRGLIFAHLEMPDEALSDLLKARSLRPESRQVKAALQQLQADYNIDIHSSRKRTRPRAAKLLPFNRGRLSWFN